MSGRGTHLGVVPAYNEQADRYALLWPLAGIVMLGPSIWKGALEQIAQLVGITYPPHALFLGAFGFVLVLLMHFSLAVSCLSDQIRVLAQRLGLVEQRLAASKERREHRRRQLDPCGDIQNGGSEVEKYAEACT